MTRHVALTSILLAECHGTENLKGVEVKVKDIAIAVVGYKKHWLLSRCLNHFGSIFSLACQDFGIELDLAGSKDSELFRYPNRIYLKSHSIYQCLQSK